MVDMGFAPDLMQSGDYFGVLAQYPSTVGQVHDMRPHVQEAHARGALFVVAFLFILVVGFVYEWKKGALEWE